MLGDDICYTEKQSRLREMEIRGYSNRDINDMRNSSVWISQRTAFQKGRTTRTNTLKKEHVHPACGTARRLFYVNE